MNTQTNIRLRINLCITLKRTNAHLLEMRNTQSSVYKHVYEHSLLFITQTNKTKCLLHISRDVYYTFTECL